MKGRKPMFDREVIKADLLSGMDRCSIAEKHGCSKEYVTMMVRWHGLAGKLPSSHDRRYNDSGAKPWCLAIAMWQRGDTDVDIASVLGVSRQRIGQMKALARQYGVSLSRRNEETLNQTHQLLTEIRDVLDVYEDKASELRTACGYAIAACPEVESQVEP